MSYLPITSGLAWDALGRLTGETSARGTVGYQYDLAGNRTRLTWPDGFYVTYDTLLTGEVTAIRENGASSGPGVLAAYAWDNLGRRVSLTRGNGVTTAYGYDNASRLNSLAQDFTGSAADVTFTFTHNAAGQILSRTSTNSAYHPPMAGTSKSYTVNGQNQLTAAGGASIAYTAGQLTSDGSKTYSYDYLNRLTGTTGGTSLTVTYDPLGRINYTAAASTTRFAWDGADMIGEYDYGGGLLRRYVHGPAFDEPIVWYEGSGTSDRRWYAQDWLGSVIAVTDGSGAANAINTYDEYGRPGSSNTGRFQYTGQTWLPEAGLYHYKARAYSPELGRFLQTDPIGYHEGMNLYAYVGNDPVNLIDPFGLLPPRGCASDKPCPLPPPPGCDADICVVGCKGGWTCLTDPFEIQQFRDEFGEAMVTPLLVTGPSNAPAGGDGAILRVGYGDTRPLPQCMADFLKRYYPKAEVDSVILYNASPFDLFGYSVTIDHNIYISSSKAFRDPVGHAAHIFHEFTHVRQYEAGTLTVPGYVVDAFRFRGRHRSIPTEIQAGSYAAKLTEVFRNSPEARRC